MPVKTLTANTTSDYPTVLEGLLGKPALPQILFCFQMCESDLVAELRHKRAVSPLGQDDGLHVLPVQAARLRSVS